MSIFHDFHELSIIDGVGVLRYTGTAEQLWNWGRHRLVTQYLGGGGRHKTLFLTNSPEVFKYWEGTYPPPPPPPARPPLLRAPWFSSGTSWDIYVQPSVNLLQYNYSFFSTNDQRLELTTYKMLPVPKILHDFKSAAMPKYYNINAGPWTPKEALTYCLSILDISESWPLGF